MKLSHRFSLLTAVCLLGCNSAEAATAVAADPLEGGIFYYWTVNMGANDTTSFARHVGAWSWQDGVSAGNTIGWTHTSDWIALKLEVATMVTLRLESKADVLNPGPDPDEIIYAGGFLVPGMTIYSGWDNDEEPAGIGDITHAFNNRANNIWAEDTQYMTHVDGTGGHMVEVTMQMPAGEYTIVVGGNANSSENPGRQGYLMTVTTGAAVPEPASGGLLMLSGLGFLARRRRSKSKA